MQKTFLTLIIFTTFFATFFQDATPAQAAVPLKLKVVANRASGIYYSDSTFKVELTSYPGAYIVYTTDGTTPTAKIKALSLSRELVITKGKKYTGSISVTGNQTIKAIALYDFLTPISEVAVFSYETFNPTQLAKDVNLKFKSFSYSSYGTPIFYTAQNSSKGNFVKLYSGIKSGTVNCTWYTFVRIKYNLNRNIIFTSAGGLDGKYWYSKIASTSNQIKYSGNASLEKLVEVSNNRPIYNIVVSFERNGNATNGHVMLIDAIINGKVYFSDNYKPGVWQTSNSIADFKSLYRNANGNIIGIVHLK